MGPIAAGDPRQTYLSKLEGEKSMISMVWNEAGRVELALDLTSRALWPTLLAGGPPRLAYLEWAPPQGHPYQPPSPPHRPHSRGIVKNYRGSGALGASSRVKFETLPGPMFSRPAPSRLHRQTGTQTEANPNIR
jgi:hypothetical protein